MGFWKEAATIGGGIGFLLLSTAWHAFRSRNHLKTLEIRDELLVGTTLFGKRLQWAWSDLREVAVRVEEPDFMDSDVFWVLTGPDGDVVQVPQDHPGSGELLQRLQRLPDFDNAAVSNAVASVKRGRHLCWRRPAGA